MFSTAKCALAPLAVGRKLPFQATVEYRYHGKWRAEVTGSSVEYLADWYCDLKGIFRDVRIISEFGKVLFQ